MSCSLVGSHHGDLLGHSPPNVSPHPRDSSWANEDTSNVVFVLLFFFLEVRTPRSLSDDLLTALFPDHVRPPHRCLYVFPLLPCSF